WAWSGIVERGWAKITKYIIGPPFYEKGTIHILINLDTWNRLPDHLQKLLTRLGAEHEREWTPFYEKYHDQQLKGMIKAGMEHIQFSANDSKRYVDLAYDASWKSLIAKSPVKAAKLKELSSK
ncbi:hypothetical protein ACFL0M_09055, partial [Thermodesulfobacteriota bacterium]